MAAQMHFIFSSEFSAAGIVSGGPFFCNQNLFDEEQLLACTQKPENIDLGDNAQEISKLDIDSTDNIKGQKVWVYGATHDKIVVQGVQGKLVE